MTRAEDAVRRQIDQVRAFLDEGTPEGAEDAAAALRFAKGELFHAAPNIGRHARRELAGTLDSLSRQVRQRDPRLDVGEVPVEGLSGIEDIEDELGGGAF